MRNLHANMFSATLRRALQKGTTFMPCNQIKPYSVSYSQTEGKLKNEDMPHLVDMKQGDKVSTFLKISILHIFLHDYATLGDLSRLWLNFTRA